MVWIGNQTFIFVFLFWNLEFGISWCPRISFFFFFLLFSGKDSWNQRERKKHLTLLFVCCGLVAQLCLTVCDPPGLYLARLLCLWGFFRQEYWSGLPYLPTPGDLPNPGIEARYLALQADWLTSEPPEKPTWFCYFYIIIYEENYRYINELLLPIIILRVKEIHIPKYRTQDLLCKLWAFRGFPGSASG